jgi:hypothetical protein
MATLEQIVRLLLDFEHALHGTELGVKLQKLEGGLIQSMSTFAPEISDKAKMWLTVPEVGAQSGYSRAASSGAAPYKPKTTIEDRVHSAMTPFLTAMMQNANRGTVGLQPTSLASQLALQPTQQQLAAQAYQNMMAQQQATLAAAMMPGMNQQFAPRTSTTTICYYCQKTGHAQMACPSKAAGLPRVPRGQAPTVSAPSMQASMQEDLTPFKGQTWPIAPLEKIEPKAHEDVRCHDDVVCDVPSNEEEENEERGRQGGIEIAKECSCGRCGARLDGIDLMQKEQRATLQVAKNAAAKRLEQEQAALIARLSTFD